MPTISQAITEGARRLQSSGIEQERRTARLLLGHAMSVDRTHLLTRSKEDIDEATYRQYIELIQRRANGEPLQYITGHQEFYGLDFLVTPDVLIPRSETEFLVERVIALAAELTPDSPLIIDAGTGSGCIAVTLATRLPGARIIATDTSGPALDVARKNAAIHGVEDRIEFVEGDLLAPIARARLEFAVDIIASNPPYVDEEQTAKLQREVSEWEPRTALFGGADGLDFYRRLLADAPRFLKPGGHLVVEIGYGQLDGIRSLTLGSALELVDVIDDLQGLPRTVTFHAPDETSTPAAKNSLSK